MKEALAYKKLKNNITQCQVCEHQCVRKPQETGICGVRKNIKGKLYALNYGKAIAVNVDPIEKKPLFHFQPGSRSLSWATVGCNFSCKFCQNYSISQIQRQAIQSEEDVPGENLTPQDLVNLANKRNCQNIAYTYTEPIIFVEYALDTMKLAHKKNLKNVWVTNGFMSRQTLDEIIPFLDAVAVDLKAFTEKFYKEICSARLKPVLRNLQIMKEKNTWIEVITLLIPGYNDSKEELDQIAKFIKNKLGRETPWHISRFWPAYKMADVPPTPEEKINQAVAIGKKVGLKYVYAGNIPGSNFEDTFCPQCGAKIIDRTGFGPIKRYDDDGLCSKCGETLELIE